MICIKPDKIGSGLRLYLSLLGEIAKLIITPALLIQHRIACCVPGIGRVRMVIRTT